MAENENKSKRASIVPGLAVLALFLTGILAVLKTLAIKQPTTTGDAICLLAAAGAFGIIAHVSFRD